MAVDEEKETQMKISNTFLVCTSENLLVDAMCASEAEAVVGVVGCGRGGKELKESRTPGLWDRPNRRKVKPRKRKRGKPVRPKEA